MGLLLLLGPTEPGEELGEGLVPALAGALLPRLPPCALPAAVGKTEGVGETATADNV